MPGPGANPAAAARKPHYTTLDELRAGGVQALAQRHPALPRLVEQFGPSAPELPQGIDELLSKTGAPRSPPSPSKLPSPRSRPSPHPPTPGPQPRAGGWQPRRGRSTSSRRT